MITEIHFENVNDFWAALSPEKPLSTNATFIYRGQGNADWKLIPSVLRENCGSKIHKQLFGENQVIECESQVWMERRLLHIFVEHLDAQGLSFSNDSIEFRKKYLNLEASCEVYKQPSIWPIDECLELMVLAQHHGVPTRLLDWSTRSYVAAYFAASDGLKNESKQISVWALNIGKIAFNRNVQIVRAPGGISNNYAAQSGIHTIVKLSWQRGMPITVVSVDDNLRDSREGELFKITLPTEYAKDVLKLCQLYGVSASTLFPSYDGAARAVNDSINMWARK